jgi:hypothetical protein
MTHLSLLKTWALLLMLAWPLAQARADEGHDHGEAAPTAEGPALPRFTAVSELFELVGVLDGRRLTLYLDHAASNAPVKAAKLELEVAGARVPVQPKADSEGEFEVMLAAVPQAGVIAVTATVLAGQDSDLLAGELDIHDHAAAPAAQAAPGAWQALAGWGVAGLLALVLLGLGLNRWRQAQRAGSAA